MAIGWTNSQATQRQDPSQGLDVPWGKYRFTGALLPFANANGKPP